MKLEYASPESVNIDSSRLSKIGELTRKALDLLINFVKQMYATYNGAIKC